MKKGFTLVELLVVIAIIGVLTAIITANFSEARERARDAKRLSDVAQIQLALTYYFDKCNTYPASIADINDDTLCAGFPLSKFISKIPTPAEDQQYEYYVKSSGSIVSDYILRTSLESENAVLSDSLEGSFSGYVSCAQNSLSSCQFVFSVVCLQLTGLPPVYCVSSK
jgi:prepilin-type N-terminal cleavage/methylation domain-containing protein